MTLKKFSEILSDRIKYLNESARGSVAACALQVLRSLRTVTAVAKTNSIKPKLVPANEYYPSFTTRSNRSRLPCLRVKGSGARYNGNSKVVFADRPARGMEKSWHVWLVKDEYSNKERSWLIASPSKSVANRTAKRLISKRAMRYAGLAKRAISMLMMKTFNKGVSDNVPTYVSEQANKVTSKTETVQESKVSSGGTYVLTLTDELRYALDAIKGGKAQVDVQMKKALNKIASVINTKLKDTEKLFGPSKIPTPFPSIVQKRQ